MPILSPSMPSAQFSSTRLITVSTSSWGERKWVKLQTHSSIHRIPHFQNNRHLTTFDMLQKKQSLFVLPLHIKRLCIMTWLFLKHGLLMKAWSNYSKWCLVEVPENIFNKWQINIFQGCLCLCWNGNSGLIQFQHDTLASLQATAY